MSDALMAITPIDGRYASRVGDLQPIASEYGLIRYRVTVEAGWLATLGSGILPDVEPLGGVAQEALTALPDEFGIDDARRIKEIESVTNHDVKAVENWLKDRLGGDAAFADYLELVHFGCTSEDITNLSYAMMLRDARDEIILPDMESVAEVLDGKAEAYADMPMLAKTHGQPASPTTLGKEMRVFEARISSSATELARVSIMGKFGGATGNYNAATVAYPEVNWPGVSRRFVEQQGFEYNGTTTQIEPHDWMARYFNELALGNTIMTGLAQDMWAYIKNGNFKLGVVAGEVGSSTMPHKVNPIDFENAEANYGLANSTLHHLAAKLPISRLQRDLSDSSAQRAVGTALGHNVVANKSMLKGLGKVEPDEVRIAEELGAEWAVLTEAVQTVMRRHGVQGAYDAIKAVSRGRSINEADYRKLVRSVDVPKDAKRALLALTPATYTGRAADIARGIV